MSNYKQTALTGESYQRCRLVEINNPYDKTPTVTFTEERITTLGENILRDQPDAPLKMDFAPENIIDVYDPLTLLPTGSTVTMGEIYILLFSAYLHYAQIRDAVIPEPAPEPEPTPVV